MYEKQTNWEELLSNIWLHGKLSSSKLAFASETQVATFIVLAS